MKGSWDPTGRELFGILSAYGVDCGLHGGLHQGLEVSPHLSNFDTPNHLYATFMMGDTLCPRVEEGVHYL